MFYRDDWDKVKKRYEAYWNNEVLDRCVINVSVPTRPDAYLYIPYPDNKEERMKYWLDGEYLKKIWINNFENTYYAGDSLPVLYLNLGAAGQAGFFKGAKFSLNADDSTVWFFPSLENYDDLEFDQNSLLYEKTIELAKYFASENNGRYVISMPDIAGNMDALSLLRGGDRLLLDMLEKPEEVHAGLGKIIDAWKTAIDNTFDIIKDCNDGGTAIGWLKLFAPGKHAQLQADISAMISSGMFNEFFEPELRTCAKHLDNALYHLDGIEQIRHVDTLLSIEDIKAIQWTHVDGQPSPVEYIPIFKRMQKAGKKLALILKQEEIEPIMTGLSSRGLYITTSAASKEDADDIIKLVTKHTHE